MPSAQKTVLLVEGTDDEHVVKHFCGLYALGKIGEIKDLKGKSQLLDSINVHLKGSDLTRLGIMLDADGSAESTWQSVRGRLQASGYTNLPAGLSAEGMLIDDPDTDLPKVGIWIMPDNQSAGLLENFLRGLIPDEDALIKLAEQSIARIPSEQRLFSAEKTPKALMHTWLAWQQEPGYPFGTAISSGYLKPALLTTKNPVTINFVNWLRRTFFV